MGPTSSSLPSEPSYSPVNRRVLLTLAVGSLLIVACGGNTEDAADQEPTAGIAEAVSPTVEIAETPAVMPEPTVTATRPVSTTIASTPASTVTPTANGTETPGSTDDGASIRISPASGSRNTNFLFITSGLTPDQRHELVVRYPDGEEDVHEAVFDGAVMELVIVSGPYEGEPLSIWFLEPGDPLGEYTVELRDADTGGVLSSATFVAE